MSKEDVKQLWLKVQMLQPEKQRELLFRLFGALEFTNTIDPTTAGVVFDTIAHILKQMEIVKS